VRFDDLLFLKEEIHHLTPEEKEKGPELKTQKKNTVRTFHSP